MSRWTTRHGRSHMHGPFHSLANTTCRVGQTKAGSQRAKSRPEGLHASEARLSSSTPRSRGSSRLSPHPPSLLPTAHLSSSPPMAPKKPVCTQAPSLRPPSPLPHGVELPLRALTPCLDLARPHHDLLPSLPIVPFLARRPLRHPRLSLRPRLRPKRRSKRLPRRTRRRRRRTRTRARRRNRSGSRPAGTQRQRSTRTTTTRKCQTRITRTARSTRYVRRPDSTPGHKSL